MRVVVVVVLWQELAQSWMGNRVITLYNSLYSVSV